MLNHELNRNKWSSITKDRNEDYRMNVSKFDDSYRHLFLLGALDEIARREEDEESKKVFMVTTVSNDKVLSRLLRAEVFPPISCVEHVVICGCVHG